MPWPQVLEWLEKEALRNSDAALLYSELCRRLRDAGAPVLRGHASFRVLHPLYDANAFNWRADEGVVVDQVVVDRSIFAGRQPSRGIPARPASPCPQTPAADASPTVDR